MSSWKLWVVLPEEMVLPLILNGNDGVLSNPSGGCWTVQIEMRVPMSPVLREVVSYRLIVPAPEFLPSRTYRLKLHAASLGPTH